MNRFLLGLLAATALSAPAFAQTMGPAPGGSGGGGAATIADAADVTQGALADAACGTDNGTCSMEAMVKRIAQRETSLISALGSPFQAGGSIGNTSFAATQATASSLNAQVVGNVAGAASDSGNPVKTGCVFNSAPATYTNGQRTDCQSDTRGNTAITIRSADSLTGAQVASAAADAITAAIQGLYGLGLSYHFNGTTWDRIRSANSAANTTGTGLASAGLLVFDGTNWQKAKSGTDGVPQIVAGGLTSVSQTGATTRPNNTTAYAANQAWCASTVSDCTPIQVPVAGANAATGTLGRVMFGKSGLTLTNANFSLWFFSASPTVSGVHDASAYVGPYQADLATYLGSYQCNGMQATNDGTAKAFSECFPTSQQGVQYKAVSGQTYVYALISVTGAYTPAANEVGTIYANAYQDK